MDTFIAFLLGCAMIAFVFWVGSFVLQFAFGIIALIIGGFVSGVQWLWGKLTK